MLFLVKLLVDVGTWETLAALLWEVSVDKYKSEETEKALS
jgi:hypothetical protein